MKWYIISSNKEIISLELIQKYGDRLILHELTKHGVNENIIIHYLPKMDLICWINVSQFTKLSMDFIKKHIDKLNLHNAILICGFLFSLLFSLIISFSYSSKRKNVALESVKTSLRKAQKIAKMGSWVWEIGRAHV